MELKTIYQPVLKELSKVELELKYQFVSIGKEQKCVRKIMNYLAEVSGKRLRSALVLLSSKSVNGHKGDSDDGSILLATTLELVHNASLIHDDIIDKEEERRGKESLNKKYGNKIAMLAGDMLYLRAFSLLIGRLNSRILGIITRCAEKMCYGEITEISKDISSFKDYLKIIKYKTASFTSICCETAAILSKATEKKVSNLKGFGLNFGIAYQLRDDYLDKDGLFKLGRNSIGKIKQYVIQAGRSIELLENSEYKESLKNLAKKCLEFDAPF